MPNKIVSIPNKINFCGGNFQDWLEVMTTDECNGKCSWCIEKKGYHPTEHVSWDKLAREIIDCNKTNIIFLGGEPTLYKDLKKVIIAVSAITNHKKKLYVTTNGSMLTPKYVEFSLYRLTGINISIHHYDLERNYDITGIPLEMLVLQASIKELHKNSTSVRLNCNLIRDQVDSEKSVLSYIEFAKELGADSVRFAELKDDEDNFVDMAEVFGNKYGLNNDPFTFGCNSNTVINDMPINFRQMCGLQTSKRPKPINPKQADKTVLYYDGIFYNGWQSKYGGYCMNSKELKSLLKDVAKGAVTVEEAQKRMEKATAAERVEAKSVKAALHIALKANSM